MIDLMSKGYSKDPKNWPNILEYIEHPVFDKLW